MRMDVGVTWLLPNEISAEENISEHLLRQDNDYRPYYYYYYYEGSEKVSCASIKKQPVEYL